MAEVGIPGEEDFHELDKYKLRTIRDLTPEDCARLRQRIDDFTRRGMIKPNAFDPLEKRRKLRWPQPVPRDPPPKANGVRVRFQSPPKIAEST